MIFAADLDRTLIFSRARLDPTGPSVIPVEYRQGEPFGFMTPGALAAFEEIRRRSVCFLNTFRGLEQARRVTFVPDCPYLALQNGLYLYRYGVEDAEWSAYVRRTVDDLPISLTDGIRLVESGLPGIRCLSKQYEYLAVFFVEEDTFDDALCVRMDRMLTPMGWRLVRQRKKLYLSPAEIDKGSVLDRVRWWEDGADAVGFGDSGFDLPMLRRCRIAWSLRDCELWDLTDELQFSHAPAQAGTEEVLGQILSYLIQEDKGR